PDVGTRRFPANFPPRLATSVAELLVGSSLRLSNLFLSLATDVPMAESCTRLAHRIVRCGCASWRPYSVGGQQWREKTLRTGDHCALSTESPLCLADGRASSRPAACDQPTLSHVGSLPACDPGSHRGWRHRCRLARRPACCQIAMDSGRGK